MNSYVNENDNVSLYKGDGTKRTNSLIRSMTNFKIEPSHFRCEKKKESLGDKYEIQGTLGQGSYGEVKKIISHGTGEVRALKIICKTQCQQTDNFSDEIEIIKKLVINW